MKEERDAILLMGKLPLKEHAQPPETDRGGEMESSVLLAEGNAAELEPWCLPSEIHSKL